MRKTRLHHDNRGVTPAIGVILVVMITVILAATVGAYAFGVVDEIDEKPTYAALELNFDEEPASKPAYEEFRWQIELTHTGGETVDADEIVVQLNHGNQRVTGTLDRSLQAGETVELVIVHNNQAGNTIPSDLSCDDVNVACRLAGDDGNYPDDNEIYLRMLHGPSETILYEETIGISGSYGIYNGNAADVSITDEELTFA